MRRIRSLVVLSLLVAAACQDTSAPTAVPDVAATLNPVATSPQAQDRVMPGQVLMAVRPGEDPAAVAAAHGVSIAARGYRDAFFVLRGAVGNERALAARIAADARVAYAEPNWLREPTIDPRLWAFYNPGGLTISFTQGPNKGSVVGSKVSTNDADIDNVEGYASGGSPVVIGSIDTGVDFGHTEFLAGQLIAGADWYSGDNDPSDTQGHGTHTTGTMVGRTVGVAGVSGAGANVSVYVQRVCGQIGCPTSAIVNAINAAADYPGMVAMNLSLGGSSESQSERDAIAYATAHNVLVIASAGNNGTSTISCPACDPNAISVAALNWQDQLSYFSNWGNGLDISAPGGEMYSNTTEEGGIYSSVPGGYAYYQGTSMAAPMVTGTAGVVASKNATLRGASLRARILGTADALGNSNQFGAGRVNAYRAVTGGTLTENGSGSGSGTGDGGPALTASFTYGCTGTACNFDAGGSTGATSWAWDFGDGNGGSGETTTHTYGGAGNYTVELTVGDGNGGSASTTQSINCKNRGKNGLVCN